MEENSGKNKGKTDPSIKFSSSEHIRGIALLPGALSRTH